MKQENPQYDLGIMVLNKPLIPKISRSKVINALKATPHFFLQKQSGLCL